ncbi:SpdD protein [Streptomyces sp. NPDC051320]|uniref:SpdD protein n=1 Tax=Streptomyces sp. NPDC051320 TaxID=3154644 RepID=UPI0034322C61
MFKPKYPTPDVFAPAVITSAPAPVADPAPVVIHQAPAPTPTALGTALEVVKEHPLGVAAGLVIVGFVFVSMFLAVAITAASVAVLAVVLRSLMNTPKGR